MRRGQTPRNGRQLPRSHSSSRSCAQFTLRSSRAARVEAFRAMASFSGLAGKVRSITESDEFDLGSISSAYDAGRLITDAFSTPFSDRDEMVRVTLVVGAGKANRQKYDASLQKWIVAALKAIDYEDNKSASCDFDSAGSFKTQHDTGRNLIFVHVFPGCSQKKAVSHDDDEATADEPARLSREHLLVAAEMKTFERTVAKRCPTWSCRSVCRRSCARSGRSCDNRREAHEPRGAR